MVVGRGERWEGREGREEENCDKPDKQRAATWNASRNTLGTSSSSTMRETNVERVPPVPWTRGGGVCEVPGTAHVEKVAAAWNGKTSE